MQNHEIAKVFRRIVKMMELLSGNPFRIRSFQRAAQIIEDLPYNVAEAVKDNPARLEAVPGIGRGTLARIQEIVQTGTCHDLEDLRARVPPSLLELLELQNLGPRTVYRFWKELGITNLAQLEQALEQGKVEQMPGMGPRRAALIRDSIRRYRRRSGRCRLDHAMSTSEALAQYLRMAPELGQIEVAGSLRRRRETIGDVDILVTSNRPKEMIAHFLEYPEIQEVAAQGSTKASVRLRDGINCDLRVVEREAFGAALQYFTGSKEHNVALRERAKRMGCKISEYGLFNSETQERLAGREEEEIYRRLGLAFIPPELRENRGEIEAAEAGHLPKLVELSDIRGDLHSHTTASDGNNSLQEMAEAARQLGYEYLAITDHSHALAMTGGLDEDGLRRQIEEIKELDQRQEDITILSGIEVDILKSGELDLEDSVLAETDVVIASIHSHLTMGRRQMTRRICRALEHPQVNVLAHPTGRILLKRDPYPIDLDEVIASARRHRVCLELNAHPKRLDLWDVACRSARRQGVLITVNSDSHRPSGFGYLRYGIYTARRAWLQAEDVINTYPIGRLKKVLAKIEEYFPSGS